MLTTNPDQRALESPRQTARWAAIFYTALVIFGGFAHVYVRGKVYVPGDAAETASRISEHESLVRFGVFSDLVGVVAYLLLAFAFHRLLRHISRDLANVMVVLVAIAVGITSLNMIFQVGGILTATDPSYTQGLAFSDAQALTLLLFDLQFYGYILVQVFTGLWLVPLALLAHKSNGFPKPLCWLLIIGCVCYLVDLLIHLMFPDAGRDSSDFVVATAIVAEMWMVGYLWFRGVGKKFVGAET